LFDFRKWFPTFAEKHTNPFSGGRTKQGSLWEKSFWQKQGYLETPDIPGQKSHQTFGQVWRTSGKNRSHAQKFACSYTYAQRLAKNIFAGWAKSGKISFSPLETKKTFFAKYFMGKFQISKSWGALPSHPTPMLLKRFITKRLRKITKIYLLISI